MALEQLDKAKWQPFFDGVSRTAASKRVDVEIASLKLGDQVQAKSLPLLGMVYDPKDDIVEIALEGLDHIIHAPRAIYIDRAAASVNSIEIVDADDERQIVQLRDPVMLPSPH
jgi:uncharacterized protein DUF5335